jgi:hypothetical protein
MNNYGSQTNDGLIDSLPPDSALTNKEVQQRTKSLSDIASVSNRLSAERKPYVSPRLERHDVVETTGFDFPPLS